MKLVSMHSACRQGNGAPQNETTQGEKNRKRLKKDYYIQELCVRCSTYFTRHDRLTPSIPIWAMDASQGTNSFNLHTIFKRLALNSVVSSRLILSC